MWYYLRGKCQLPSQIKYWIFHEAPKFLLMNPISADSVAFVNKLFMYLFQYFLRHGRPLYKFCFTIFLSYHVNLCPTILHICRVVKKKKKLKLNAKNNHENNQFSAIFGISKQILEKKFSAKYTEVYTNRNRLLSAFHYLFFHKNILYTPLFSPDNQQDVNFKQKNSSWF